MTTDNKKVVIPVVGDATGVKQTFDEVKVAARDMAQVVDKAGQDAARGIDKIPAGADAAAAKIDGAAGKMATAVRRVGEGASKGGQEAARGLEKAADAAEKAGIKTEAVQRKFEASVRKAMELNQALAAGPRGSAGFIETRASQAGADVGALKPMLDQLRALEAAQKSANTAVVAGATTLNTLGMSSRATAAAMRQVPAQFQDIVVSLQAGQAPLTVLLQQGSQLSTVFGGIGPAARALAGYLVGLVNPFTVAAAAVGILGVAYYQGSKENDAFARSLILTGDAAGATVSRLQEVARSVSAIAGTQGAAADAVAQLAGTGKVAADNLGQFATVALLLEKNVGVAVKETVKQFEELGRAPVEASLKLTEKANYLTTAVYEQIRALQDQGRTTEAAALAQKTYADAMGIAAQRVEGNLGSIESAWRSITSTAKEAWDAMLGVGRRQTLGDQADALRERIAANERERAMTGAFGREGIDKGLNVLRQQLNLLTEQDRLMKRGAEAAADRAKAEQAGIEFSKIEYENRTKQQKAETEIAKVRQLGLQAGRTELEIEKQVASIREKYKDKAGESAAKAAATQYAELLLRVRERVKLADEELRAGRQLTEAEKLEAQVTEMLASAKNKLNPAQQAAVVSALQEAKAREVLVAVQRSELAQALEIAKARQAARNADYGQSAEAVRAIEEARAASVATVRDQVKALQEEAQARELAIALNISQEEAIERVTIARLREKQAMLVDGSEGAKAVEAEIEAREKLAGLIGDRAAFQKQVDGLREIDQVAREVFRDVGENGVSAFQRIGKTIKSAVLDLIYQMTIRPILIQVVGSMTGASGGAITQAIGGNGGMFGGMGGNLLSLGGQAMGWGSMSGANVAGSVYANAMGTGIDGLLATNGAYGTATAGGTAAGIGSAAAGAGALAVIGYAALQTYKESLGEKRSGASFGYDAASGSTKLLTQASGGRPDGADQTVTALINATVLGLNDTFKAAGSKIRVTDLIGAWEASMNDRGGVFSGGTLSNGVKFGESGAGTNYDPRNPMESKYEWWGKNGTASVGWRDTPGGAVTRMFGTDPGMDMDGDPAKLAVDMQQSFIAALQASVGIMPTITERRTTSQEAVGWTDAGTEMRDVVSYEWVRTFDAEMRDRAKELGLLPKKILDLIVNVDPEALSERATLKLTTKIQTLVANVNGFRQIVDALPMDKLKKLSFDAAAGLVKVAGGLEALQANLGTYVQNFYSAEEQRQQVAKNISSTLQGAGLNLSAKDILGTSREEFRALVEKYEDRTSYTGQKLYATLLSVSGAFASITQVTQDLGNAAEQAAADLKAAAIETARGGVMDAYQRQIDAAQAASARAEQARDALRDAYSRESDALKDVATRHRDYASQLRGVRDSLTAGDGSTLSRAAQTTAARKAFDSAAKSATKGDETALGNLGGLATDFVSAARESARTPAELAAAIARAQAGLTIAATSSDGRATMAEQQLSALDKQVKGLGVLNDSVLSVKDAIKQYVKAEKESSIADQQVKAAKAQLLSLGLLNDSVLTMAAAFKLYAKATGVKLPAFADGGLAFGGALVGEQGAEYADFKSPARIYTAEQTRGMFSPNTELVVVMQEMAAEIKALRDDTRRIGNASVNEQQKTATILKKIDTIGIAERDTA